MWRFLLSCIRIIGIVTKYFTPSTDVISFLKVPFSANPNSYPISFNLLNSFGAKDGSSNLPMNEWSWWCQHTKNIFCPKKKIFFRNEMMTIFPSFLRLKMVFLFWRQSNKTGVSNSSEPQNNFFKFFSKKTRCIKISKIHYYFFKILNVF